MELAGGLLMLGLMVLVGLVSSVCSIIILVSAFQDDIIEGILCLLCPFYILYYGGWKFDHDKRALILGGNRAVGVVGPNRCLACVNHATVTGWTGFNGRCQTLVERERT